MILQILYEGKKLLRSPWVWLGFFAVLLGSLFLNTLHVSTNWQGYAEDGSILKGEQVIAYEQEIQKGYEGEMDDAWFQALHMEVEQAIKQDAMLRVDHTKMEEAYGRDWLSLYCEAPYRFLDIEVMEQNPDASFDELPFYTMDAYKNGVLLKRTILEELQNGYAGFVKERLWNQTHEEKKDAYWTRRMSQQEQQKVLADLNKRASFFYGESTGWKMVLNGFAGAYFLFPIFLIILTSQMFNKEKSSNMMELIKTSSYGKRKVAYAKLLAGILLTLMFTWLLVGGILLYAYSRYDLGNWNALLSVLNAGAINPFTLKDAVLGGIWMITIGALVVSIVSMFLSCMLKSRYASLVLSIVVFILPALIQNDVMKLMPIHFMEVKNVFFSIQMLSLFHSLYYFVEVVWIWILPMVMFCITSIWQYRSYHLSVIAD